MPVKVPVEETKPLAAFNATVVPLRLLAVDRLPLLAVRVTVPVALMVLPDNPEIKVGEVTSTGSQFMGFQQTRADIGNGTRANPYKDPKVRIAIRHAVDIASLQSKVMRGTASVGKAIYTSAIDGFDPRFKGTHPYDPEKARALLKEAG